METQAVPEQPEVKIPKFFSVRAQNGEPGQGHYMPTMCAAACGAKACAHPRIEGRHYVSDEHGEIQVPSEFAAHALHMETLFRHREQHDAVLLQRATDALQKKRQATSMDELIAALKGQPAAQEDLIAKLSLIQGPAIAKAIVDALKTPGAEAELVKAREDADMARLEADEAKAELAKLKSAATTPGAASEDPKPKAEDKSADGKKK